MKKLLLYCLLFVSAAMNSQTLDDFPWLSQMIDPASCCEVNTATAYWNQGVYFVYVQSSANCSSGYGKLFSEQGECWCTDWSGLNCLDYYIFENSAELYACSGTTPDLDLFSLYPWLTSVTDPNNCCAEQSITAYQINNNSFVYVQPDPACSSEPGKLYFEDGQVWCTDYGDFSCLDFYINENLSFGDWSCGGSGCTETTWYQDLDGDGLGNPNAFVSSCDQPAGYVGNNSDTDDGCNGVVDVCGVCNGSGELQWCQDLDGDGLGNPSVAVLSCTQPAGYVSNCSDTNDGCNGVVDVCGVCNGSGELQWCQDLDGDGLGNPSVTVLSCTQPAGYVSDCSDTDDAGGTNSLHPAFSEFDTGSYTIYLDGDEVVIESDGLPNHTSPYWSNTTPRCLNGPMGMGEICTNEDTTEDHPLFVEPTATAFATMAPGNIDDFNGSYTLRIPVNPVLAASASSTGLGPIGMAVSGSMIYNDEEGPNVPLNNALPSLDYTAAHTGPQSYHYHLEPHAWSNDDDKLIGIIADGFFIYGRKDYDGNYPTDLDASGGHFGPTIHNPDGEYHYHIQNETFLNEYYIIFPGDYQGTPNGIQ